MKDQHYADRDHAELDREGGYYCRHVSAMTAERLHDKSAIAGELAWRDREIDRLRAAWRPIETAPSDTFGIAVYARMTCCGGSGRVVMVAARSAGVWVYPSDHQFEFTHWMPLPAPPTDQPQSGRKLQ